MSLTQRECTGLCLAQCTVRCGRQQLPAQQLVGLRGGRRAVVQQLLQSPECIERTSALGGLAALLARRRGCCAGPAAASAGRARACRTTAAAPARAACPIRPLAAISPGLRSLLPHRARRQHSAPISRQRHPCSLSRAASISGKDRDAPQPRRPLTTTSRTSATRSKRRSRRRPLLRRGSTRCAPRAHAEQTFATAHSLLLRSGNSGARW